MYAMVNWFIIIHNWRVFIAISQSDFLHSL